MKHLNPRQGITTPVGPAHRDDRVDGVKHLNPRQGITTRCAPRRSSTDRTGACETPKSPPGDYNASVSSFCSFFRSWSGVKHLNPRQGITTGRCGLRLSASTTRVCETPKSPPGDYNGVRKSDAFPVQLRCVKHLNPRQGITTHTVGAGQHRQQHTV